MEESWPNLFIPGAGKSGTTSLHFYLQQHPDIWMSKDKEPAFFSNNTKNKKYYLSLFVEGRSCKYRGESSTAYMMSDTAIKEIKRYVLAPKFIFILRNPVDRAYSHYNWLKGIGFETSSFEEAFLHDKENAFVTTEKTPVGDKSYFQEGCYGKWITQYDDSFGKENIHVVTTEGLWENSLKTLNACFNFLNLAQLKFLQEVSKNETKFLTNPNFYRKVQILLSVEGDDAMKVFYRKILPDSVRIKLRNFIISGLNTYKNKFAQGGNAPPLSEAQRAWVAKFYIEDVKKLKKVIGKGFDQWSDFI